MLYQAIEKSHFSDYIEAPKLKYVGIFGYSNYNEYLSCPSCFQCCFNFLKIFNDNFLSCPWKKTFSSLKLCHHSKTISLSPEGVFPFLCSIKSAHEVKFLYSFGEFFCLIFTGILKHIFMTNVTGNWLSLKVSQVLVRGRAGIFWWGSMQLSEK